MIPKAQHRLCTMVEDGATFANNCFEIKCRITKQLNESNRLRKAGSVDLCSYFAAGGGRILCDILLREVVTV